MSIIPKINHNRFYGPDFFGPSFAGLVEEDNNKTKGIFNWNYEGDWRVWLWMRIEIKGEDRLIVSQFDVKVVSPREVLGIHFLINGSAKSISQIAFLFLVFLLVI